MSNFTSSTVEAPGAHLVRVFATPGTKAGGNPAPVWLQANDFSDETMQALARASGHESAFVLDPTDGLSRYQMRYFVPAHEMEMCGHATIAALWLLHHVEAWDGAATTVQTRSGQVHGRLVDGMVEISQPDAKLESVDPELICDIAKCLGVDAAQIAAPVLNAATSRVKTLIRLSSPRELNALRPDFSRVEALCERLGSTGLYPFAIAAESKSSLTAAARQFPKSSGYPEDPATGIAATALAWGLRALALASEEATLVTVQQGEAMGSASSILVRLPAAIDKDQICWLRGDAHELEDHHEQS